jgi:hypothetical protein
MRTLIAHMEEGFRIRREGLPLELKPAPRAGTGSGGAYAVGEEILFAPSTGQVWVGAAKDEMLAGLRERGRMDRVVRKP